MSSNHNAGADPSDGERQVLQEALEEAQLLYRLSVELCSATTLEETVHAMARPFEGAQEVTASLGIVEPDAQGVPEWLNVVARWPTAAPAGAKTRFHLPEFPTADLWRFNPEALLLIADVDNDPRLDAGSRQVLRDLRVQSSVMMSVASKGRCIGFFCVNWKSPRRFRDRDRRICEALAKLAGLVIDNRLMLERMDKALKTNQRQRLALAAILDNLPVGVVVTDLPPTTVLLTNREATRLTGVSVGPVGPVPVPVVDPGQAAERPRVTLAGRDTPLTFDELPLSRVLATGQVQTAELELSLEGGTRVSVESIAAPIPDEQGATHSAVVVFSDVSARKRAEAERRSMQDELIRMQAAALAERSTPLIPITDEILVLPLIGSLDTERSAQLLDVLLQGVSQNGAKVAIIDITGVRTLDTQAASALTQAAQALRLLGVDPILTGIRAEVAQTLVSLGVPLAGIVTRSTLQRGIAYARKRLGQKDLDE